MFVTTANTIDTIPKPLLDRMEVIQLSSYTYEEKFKIAKRHLIKKQTEAHGLSKDKIIFTDEAVEDIINLYTRESGVRNLEREIAAVCRKATSRLVQSGDASITVTREMVREFLKAPRFTYDLVGDYDRVGVVNGLAWTATGGVTLNVEATAFKGTGQLQLTGMMGDVMKESAKTGLSLVRSKAPDLSIDESFHKDKDIHIHIPEGAIPKDGPSAGITMVTAIVSVLSGRPVKRNIAMTGEVTLTGRVLAIGGLKEKALAALRAGINKIIMPKENEKDYLDFPEELQERITPFFVEDIDEVLEKALVKDED
jgi:ATP-dependent Lon protease